MKWKLDENLGTGAAAIFTRAGIGDVETVPNEGLSGCTDRLLFDRCSSEQRCLVTLDLDFSNVVAFPPSRSAGIAVLRLPKQFNQTTIYELIGNLLSMARKEPIEGKLWIVEKDKIRIHQEKSEA